MGDHVNPTLAIHKWSSGTHNHNCEVNGGSTSGTDSCCWTPVSRASTLASSQVSPSHITVKQEDTYYESGATLSLTLGHSLTTFPTASASLIEAYSAEAGNTVEENTAPDNRLAILAGPVKEEIQENLAMVSRSEGVDHRIQMAMTLQKFREIEQQIIRESSFAHSSSEINSEGGRKRVCLRTDLKAAKRMEFSGLWLCTDPEYIIVGEIPGLIAGDCFKYWTEMAVLGLHRGQERVATTCAHRGNAPDQFHGPLACKRRSCSTVASTFLEIAASIVIGIDELFGHFGSDPEFIAFNRKRKRRRSTVINQDEQRSRWEMHALKNSHDVSNPIRVIKTLKHPDFGTFYKYLGLFCVSALKVLSKPGPLNHEKGTFAILMERLSGQTQMESLHVHVPAPPFFLHSVLEQ